MDEKAVLKASMHMDPKEALKRIDLLCQQHMGDGTDAWNFYDTCRIALILAIDTD